MNSRECDLAFTAMVEPIQPQFDESKIIGDEILEWDEVVPQSVYDAMFDKLTQPLMDEDFDRITAPVRNELADRPILFKDALDQRYIRTLGKALLEGKKVQGTLKMASLALAHKYGLEDDEIDQVIQLAMAAELSMQQALNSSKEATEEDQN